jgi:hypothetical protein
MMRTRRVIKKETTKDDVLVCLGFAVHIGRGILHDTIATGTWYYCSGLGLIFVIGVSLGRRKTEKQNTSHNEPLTFMSLIFDLEVIDKFDNDFRDDLISQQVNMKEIENNTSIQVLPGASLSTYVQYVNENALFTFKMYVQRRGLERAEDCHPFC